MTTALYTQNNTFALKTLTNSAVQQIQSLQARVPAIIAPLVDYAFYTLPQQQQDIPAIERWAERIRDRAAHLVVLGTGGSSLGAMMLTSLRHARFMPAGVTIHYVDNADPDTMEQLFTQLPLADSFFLAVSKSGNTVETLSQFLLVLQHLQQDDLPIAEQCLAITMQGDRPLRRLAEQFSIPVLDHDGALGGRFSVLSGVGLLPAAVAGLNLYALREGANAIIQALEKNPAESEPAKGAALHFALMQHGKPMNILMPYADKLENLGRWYQQLWAESVGKQGLGTTPIRALGAVDQHSQLQLYLDGPADKFITLLGVSPQGQGERISASLAAQAGMDGIGNRPIGSIIAAQQQGTLQTLVRKNIPVREITLPSLAEESIGALLQHSMLETVMMAGFLEVDAFDQPAVEESKILAREWLASHNE
jgi:glucose-6-phosphate isomerase